MNKSKTVITEPTRKPKASQAVVAFKQLAEQIDLGSKENTDGLFGQKVVIKSGNVTIRNSELDCEFNIEFDDDTAANSAEIVIYNMTDKTVNKFAIDAKITVTAGYGNDTGVIFEGYITSKKTHFEDVDKVTRIKAVDDRSRESKTVESITYVAGMKAGYILRDLCYRTGLPIATFKVTDDYTYTDAVTVDGDLFEAIKQYAAVCKVSAFVCKGKIYVKPLSEGGGATGTQAKFRLSADTGLLSVSEFEEEQNGETVKGFDVEMLLQHRVQTASVIVLDSRNYQGTFYVREGTHSYSGDEFKTTARLVQA